MSLRCFASSSDAFGSVEMRGGVVHKTGSLLDEDTVAWASSPIADFHHANLKVDGANKVVCRDVVHWILAFFKCF